MNIDLNTSRSQFPFLRNRRSKIKRTKALFDKQTFQLEPLENRLLLSVGIIVGAPNWIDQGPGPINGGNNVQITNNPQAGAIEAVAVDPSNANRVFVATVNGGVWRTGNATDANPTWTPLTDQFPSLSMGAIAFDPNDASHNTLWAGTGRFSNGRGDGEQQIGLLKTTDGGNTWIRMGQNQLTGENIESVVPTTTMVAGKEVVLVAGDNNGVWRSTDGGDSFVNISDGAPNHLPFADGASQLVGDPGNANRFYVGIPGQGVFITNDAGATWSPANGSGSGALAGFGSSSRIELSVSAAAGNPVYAAIVDSNGQLAVVARSGDQGANWHTIGTAPDINQGKQGGINIAIVADPTDANLVYVSGDRGPTDNAGNLFRGHADTDTWDQFDHGGANSTAPHPDSRDLAFDPNGDIILTNDGGIYKLVNPNSSSRTWVSMNGNISPTELYNLSYDSVNNDLFGGAQDNGSPQQPSSGSFLWNDQSGADGTLTAVDNTSDPNHSIHYFSTQNFGNFTRKTFDNANNLTDTHSISLIVAGTGGKNLFQVEGASTAEEVEDGEGEGDSTIRFVQPYALNAADPTRLIVGTNFLYESTDQGDNLTALGGVADAGGGNFKAINPIGSVDPVGFGGSNHGNPIAYGGFDGSTPVPDVLWVGGGGSLWLRSSGTGMPTKVDAYTNAGGGGVQDIALDPKNWRDAFVLDINGKVWETPDAGVTWNNLTGNLGNFTTDLRTIAVVETSGGRALLVGGDGGVYRDINPSPSSTNWLKFGTGLPNSIVKDIQYDATDDVLLAGTWGRGAWTVSNASSSILVPGVLQITGDTDFSGEDDKIKLVIDGNNPSLLDVFLNSNLTQVQLATIQQINVDGLGGNDTLTVDDSNGLINVGNGIRYDGGTGNNDLQLVQTGGPTRSSDTYDIGSADGSGVSTIIGGGGAGTQVVSFENLAPVTDLVPAASLTVNATASNNAISYGPGLLLTEGLVSVDQHEPITFANKTTLIINSGAGQDSISLNNPNTPTGLATISVNGGDPTAGDSLIVTGMGGDVSVDTNSGDITGASGGAGEVAIAYSGIENLNLASGIANLTLTTTAADDTLVVTPGSNGGANSGSLSSDGAGPQISFVNSGDLNADLGGGDDALVVNGSSNADTMVISDTTVAISGRRTVNYSDVEALTVNGNAGSDTFSVTPSGTVSMFIDGGDPIGALPGDELDINAGGAPVTFNAGPQTDEGSFVVGTDQPVSFDHIESFGINGSGPATINGTNGPDTITVIARDSSYNAAADGIQDFTVSVNTGPNLLFINVPSLTINSLSGSDQITVQAPAPSPAGPWDVNVTINGGPPAADTDRVIVQTPGAPENVVYTPTAFDGGMLNLATLSSVVTLTGIEVLTYDGQGGNDSLTVMGTSGADTIALTPGANDQAGTFQVNSLLALSYQNLGIGGSLTVNGDLGTDTLVYNGTLNNDAFTIGVAGQVNLNSRLVVNTTGVEILTLNGFDGDDTFTLVPAISASPYQTMNLNGGGQASATGDRVYLIGTSGADDIHVSGQAVSLGGKTINGSGIEDIRLDAMGGNDLLTYDGVSGVSENITVASSGAVGGGQIRVPGVSLVDFSNAERISVNGNAPTATETDTLTFAGTNAPDTFKVNLAAAGTGSDPILNLLNGSSALLTLQNYTNFNTLNVQGLDGEDTFNVFTAATGPSRNLFIDGGAPTGKKKSTDNLNVFYASPKPSIIHSTATQDPDAGLVDLNYGTARFLVQYDDVEQVVIRKQ